MKVCSKMRRPLLLLFTVLATLFLADQLRKRSRTGCSDESRYGATDFEGKSINDGPTLQNLEFYVSLSSTGYYLSSLPLAVLGWMQIGATPVICLVGKEDEFEDESRIVLEFLRSLEIRMTFLSTSTILPATISQNCRLYAATSESLNLPEEAVVITGDSDYVPIHFRNHWENNDADIHLFNSRCCGNQQLMGEEFPMYPMCTIAMRKRTWKQVLVNTTDVYGNASRIEEELFSLFGKETFKGNGYLKTKKLSNHPSWFYDQISVSYRIHMWLKRMKGAAKVTEQPSVTGRIDRAQWPTEKEFAEMNMCKHTDAHLLRNAMAEWPLVRPLMVRILDERLMALADQYAESLQNFRRS